MLKENLNSKSQKIYDELLTKYKESEEYKKRKKLNKVKWIVILTVLLVILSVDLRNIIIDYYKKTYLKTNEYGYKEYINNKDGSVLIYIPAGEFTMGSESGEDDEKPVHKVYLDGYYMMKYEVTNKQYKKFCDETGRSYPPDPGFNGTSYYFTNYPEYPVVNVSWNDAKAYCAWAGLRLPTEAEWEKAARGTDSRKYPWGDGEPGTNRCNYTGTEDGYRYTSPIGSYERGRSPYGCYDMSGNVWEWSNDWYGESYYRTSEYKNPKGPSSGSYRVFRGSSWRGNGYGIRTAYRNSGNPANMYYGNGFRCAASE
ncbi:MAG: formylglycine-generating enzyme family protein [bacterium]